MGYIVKVRTIEKLEELPHISRWEWLLEGTPIFSATTADGRKYFFPAQSIVDIYVEQQ